MVISVDRTYDRMTRWELEMVVDCDSCEVRGLACQDCVISVLLGAPPSVELDTSEQRAIDVLAGAGLVPKLRLIPINPTVNTPEVA